MDKVCILGGLRSYIGKENGMYRSIPAEKLGAAVLSILKERFPEAEPEQIIMGNGAACGGNIARLTALEAGFPETTPAFTVDAQCCSGLESFSLAAALIESGQAECIAAGGTESCSTQPLRAMNPNHPCYKEGFYTTAQFIPGYHSENAMLEGAEKTALDMKISRHDLDNYVLESHKRAAEAEKGKKLEGLAVSVFSSVRDELIRPAMSQRLIDKMPPVLPCGSVLTAANTCAKSDGAAFILLCSDSYARKKWLKPTARLKNAVLTGGDPRRSPIAAVSSVERLLKICGLNESDISCCEYNEAFAVIDALMEKRFPVLFGRSCPYGGALAYGHPYGASGAIILLHLLRALESSDGRLGLCSVAGAGGVGCSALIERF